MIFPPINRAYRRSISSCKYCRRLSEEGWLETASGLWSKALHEPLQLLAKTALLLGQTFRTAGPRIGIPLLFAKSPVEKLALFSHQFTEALECVGERLIALPMAAARTSSHMQIFQQALQHS